MLTNYEKQDVAQPGQMYDTSNNLIISVENTNDTLQFGDFVVNDSGSIVKWNSDDYANKKPVGVVLYNALEIEGKPSDKSKIPLISRGTVWVSVDDTDAGFANVKKGAIAYLNAVSGELTGFIDDVITSQKIGVFLEDPSALNEGGHIAAIELRLFAKNTNNVIVIESGNDDPPLPPSGSIIYYNEPDGSLRSSSASGYSYLNPKPYLFSYNTNINLSISQNELNNGANVPFGSLWENSNFSLSNEQVIFTGSYVCHVQISISLNAIDNTELIEFHMQGGPQGLNTFPESYFYLPINNSDSSSGVVFMQTMEPGETMVLKALSVNASSSTTLDISSLKVNFITI